MSDLHLVLPEYTDRLQVFEPGPAIDLGNRKITVTEAVFRDHVGTRWAFDEQTKILFAGDGFSYSHYHDADQCGKIAEEIVDIDLPDMVALFETLAFNWTTHTNVEPFIERLDQLLFDDLKEELIAPTHGLPIGDPSATMPRVREGLRIGSGRSDAKAPF